MAGTAAAGWTRWRHSPPVVVDAATATFVATVEFVVIPHQHWPQTWWAELALCVVFALPLAFRRVMPSLAVGLTIAAFVVSVETLLQGTGLVVSFVAVTYSVAAYFPTRQAMLAASLLWTPILVATVSVPPELNPEGLPGAYLMLTTTATAAASYFVGRAAYNRRAYTTSLEARARTAEESQRVLAAQAVADERRRIARELHDVVAHHVSVMSVLAAGARRVLTREPDAADEALRTIEETGRASLREMRLMLSVLRTDAEREAELAPQPGLAGIEAVVEQVREAGLPVTLQVSGEPSRLDPGVALAVYRIVQEALTNTLKHAGEASASVRLEVDRRWLDLEVFDTGRGPGPGDRRVGHGVLGMRERVALYGGSLQTGPRAGGGFRVYARIPVEQPEAVPVPRAAGEEVG
jgi:signal transduction histidine kinase